MTLIRALIGVALISALAIACSCLEPAYLCAWLKPNMVAFVGRPISEVRFDKGRTKTTFQIEERLWGALPADLVSVDDTTLYAEESGKSWFVLAGRRTDSAESGGSDYFVSSACCPFGLLLPPGHAWVKEFRENVSQRKPATIELEVRSNYVRMPGIRLQLNGPAYAWEGISSESATHLKLPPGEYSVGITDPHFTLAEASRRVSVLPGACINLWILADPTASVSGTIVESRDTLTQSLTYFLEGEVEVQPTGSLWDSALVSLRRSWHRMMGWNDPAIKRISYLFHPDSDGRFQVRVLPGKYRLSAISGDKHSYVYPPPIPKTYYPGVIDAVRATEIMVPPDGKVGSIRFEFPDYGPTRRVDVVLFNEDGSPASNKVVAHTGRYPGEGSRTAGWTQKLTDSRGHVTFDVWQSLEYDLQFSERVSGDGTKIAAGSKPVSRRFVVHPWRPTPKR